MIHYFIFKTSCENQSVLISLFDWRHSACEIRWSIWDFHVANMNVSSIISWAYYYYYYWKMDRLSFSVWLIVQKKNDNNKNNNFISLNVLRSCFESLLLCFSPIILNWGRDTNHCQSPYLWPRTCIFLRLWPRTVLPN